MSLEPLCRPLIGLVLDAVPLGCAGRHDDGDDDQDHAHHQERRGHHESHQDAEHRQDAQEHPPTSESVTLLERTPFDLVDELLLQKVEGAVAADGLDRALEEPVGDPVSGGLRHESLTTVGTCPRGTIFELDVHIAFRALHGSLPSAAWRAVDCGWSAPS